MGHQLGAISLNCAFYAHDQCEGEAHQDHDPRPVRCSCPCHQDEAILK